MAEEGKAQPPPAAAADAQLFGLLSNLLQMVHHSKLCNNVFIYHLWNVESLTNQEEVELRAKIEALGLEVRKLPSKSAQHLNEMEIANELDRLSAKLDNVDELISSTMAEDPQVRSLLSSTADVWMPVITANSDERRNFTSTDGAESLEVKGKSSN